MTEDFVNGAPFYAGLTDDYTDAGGRGLFAEIQRSSSSYQRLDSMSCLKTYHKKAIIDRKTVLVVTSSPRPYHRKPNSLDGLPEYLSDNESPNSIYAVQNFVGNEFAFSIGGWMCPGTNDSFSSRECDLTNVLNGREEWSPFYQGVKVDYCLSEYIGERCTLDFCT